MSTLKSSAEDLTLNADGSGNDVIIQSDGSTKAIVTAEGNVGVGNTTPEAWDSAFSVLQLGGAAAVWGHSLRAAYLSQNMYNDGAYKYLQTSGASLILMNSGEFKFRTAASGSADATITWTEALDLGTEGDVTVPTGDIVFGTAGKGICLGATSNTDANTLDDYEEGTWTPTLVCSTSGSYVMDTGANLLAYTKIGRVVHIQGSCGIASESSPNGNLRMSLPFTPMDGAKDTDYCLGNATLANHGGSLPNNISLFISGGVTWASPYSVADDGTTSYIDHDDVDTSFGIMFSMTYIAA